MKTLLLAAVLLLAPIFAWSEYDIDQPMLTAKLNGIDIAYTEAGDPAGEPVLLIMGLTGSHRLWSESFVDGLVAAGHRVVLFDNRDTGESSRLDELGTPTLWWQLLKNALGFSVDAPYTLRDMAADGVAVLDHLGIQQAHIVGASMGGMIAQIIAAEHASRALSLVSIMSTTGAPHLPEPEADASADLQSLGDSEGEEAANLQKIGLFPEAMPRQLMAIIDAGDRSEQVRSIRVPTLVLHGEDDTLLQPPHGAHTAELITDATYITYAGMGHNMPDPVVPKILADIAKHVDSLAR